MELIQAYLSQHIFSKAIIKDLSYLYPTYIEWVEKKAPQYFYDFQLEVEPNISLHLIYDIVAKGPHLSYKNTQLYLLRNPISKQVFLIGENGIEFVNKGENEHHESTTKESKSIKRHCVCR